MANARICWLEKTTLSIEFRRKIAPCSHIFLPYTLRGDECDKALLLQALERTAEKRGSSKILTQYPEIMQEIRESDTLRRQWNKYSREYDYAKEISFDDTCDAIQKIMDEIIK